VRRQSGAVGQVLRTGQCCCSSFDVSGRCSHENVEGISRVRPASCLWLFMAVYIASVMRQRCCISGAVKRTGMTIWRVFGRGLSEDL
jgi:hypothetical protein